MSPTPSQADAGNSVMRLLKEAYLSLFVLFFQISRWKGRMKACSASICVSVIEGLLVLTLWGWIQTATHHYVELSSWSVVAAAIAIGGPTDYFLVVRNHGVAFEKQFRSFGKSKRIAMYLAAIGVIIVTGIAFYLSVAAYHQAFGLPKK